MKPRKAATKKAVSDAVKKPEAQKAAPPADLHQMIAAAWVAGYYAAGYTHDSAYADVRSTKYADEVLAAPSPR